MLEIRMFGTFDVRVRGHALPPMRYRKELWLLALLALRYDRDVPREWLATTFWPDNDESKGLFYLRKALSNIRAALGEEAGRLLTPTPRTIRLDLSGAMVDVRDFEAVVGRPHTEPGQEERLQKAVELYRGPLLQDCPEEWVLPERQHWERLYLSSLEHLASLALTRGDSVAAVRWLRLVLATEPYRESAVCNLMQTLADTGDRAAVQKVYQELRSRLREDLNTTPAPETEALYKQLSRQEAQSPTLLAPAVPTVPLLRHLPVPLTDLIGRRDEIEEVSGWLQRRRLVTLLGAGGVGKTRLSIAAADAVLSRFADGVWFVDLASLAEVSLVPEVVAKALGLTPTPGLSTEERLIEALGERSLLLVLDNCEHLVDACALLTERLLSACPGLRILATSRQALGVIGEQTYSVPSLGLPSAQEVEAYSGLLSVEKNPAFLMDYAGIQLFVQRAVLVNPAFRLERGNAQAVAEICRHLDGIPLAIEMAAARLRSLSVGEIQGRLADRFRLLTVGSRGALPRQQTLRALIDWSFSLLSAQEQALLCRLSVFAGGWSLETAEVVCTSPEEGGRPGLESWEVMDALTALVEKSLVVCEKLHSTDDTVRYRLLETIRQYAGDKLQETGESLRYRQQHRDYFLDWCAEMRPKLRGPEQALWLGRLDTEHDNLRQALAFCETEIGDGTGDNVQKGLRLMASLTTFWTTREYLNEGQQRCVSLLALAAQSAPTLIESVVWTLAGNLALCQGDNATARQHFERSLAIQKQLGDRRELAAPLGSLGTVAQQLGDYPAAQAYFEECIALCREFGLREFEATGLTCLSNLASDQMKYAEARAYATEALVICRQIGSLSIEIYILNGLGTMALAQEDYAGAIPFLEQALAVNPKVGQVSLKALTLCSLATARAALGETSAAATLYHEALSLNNEGGDLRTITGILEGIGTFLADQGRREAACQLWGAAAQFREDSKAVRPLREQDVYERATARVRVLLEVAVADAAWAAGRAMTVAEVVAFTIREMEMVRVGVEVV